MARMISREGHTSAGAKARICATYSRDMRLLSPMDRMFSRIMLHRESMLEALLDSSPDEN